MIEFLIISLALAMAFVFHLLARIEDYKDEIKYLKARSGKLRERLDLIYKIFQ